MFDFDKLANFVKQNNLKIEQDYDDTLVVKIEAGLLLKFVGFLKERSVNFETLIVSGVDQNILRYFFYTGIKSKLLVLELICDKVSTIPSLTTIYPVIYSYEQEYSAKYDIEFSGSIKHKIPYNLPPELNREIDDSETTIIPVGPVHAGVIEPGHFRFLVYGEHIINLEISLGFLHRGVEESFKGLNLIQAIELAEHVCGDSSVAYATALAQSAEKFLDLPVDLVSQYQRVVLLEMERLYNHIGDISGLINDTGFALVHARLSTLKEQLLRLNKQYFGHRFLRNNIGLATVTTILSQADAKDLLTSLQQVKIKFDQIIELTLKHNTVLERLSHTGYLHHLQAQFYSVSGLVGRASGISFDSRRDLAYAIYEQIGFKVHWRREGDVLARFNLRISETKESFRLLERCLDFFIEEKRALASRAQVKQKSRSFAWSAVESARGPVLCYLELDDKHCVKIAKMRDVSRHNWKALEYAVLNNIVPDFPLCNKSFSMAYAGTDL